MINRRKQSFTWKDRFLFYEERIGVRQSLQPTGACLIEEKGVNPWNILAITFTNKAAAEMRERVDNLVGFGSESIWVSTFHSMCVRILRRHIALLGYDANFTIYDTDDQKTLMRMCASCYRLTQKSTKSVC